MAPAAVADLYSGPMPVREHNPKQATVQASVLTGPKQLRLVRYPISNLFTLCGMLIT